jgi:hypothetical protein
MQTLPYYSAHIPILNNGYYSLKLKAIDVSGNLIECLMEPAFHMGEVTSMEENNISYPSKGF